MAELALRHPDCKCPHSDEDITQRVMELSDIVSMALVYNQEPGDCSLTMVMATISSAVVGMTAAGRTPDQIRQRLHDGIEVAIKATEQLNVQPLDLSRVNGTQH